MSFSPVCARKLFFLAEDVFQIRQITLVSDEALKVGIGLLKIFLPCVAYYVQKYVAFLRVVLLQVKLILVFLYFVVPIQVMVEIVLFSQLLQAFLHSTIGRAYD